MRILTLPLRYFWVTLMVLVIFSWLSVGCVESGEISRSKQIAFWVWFHHGHDCAVCVQDMTFIRGDGPRAGEVCRIILPRGLR